MATILYKSPVFGPIHSRRLGSSLGINLMPLNGKLCNFDCLYCECGWNKDNNGDTRLPSVHEILLPLEKRLSELAIAGTPPDSITFSGNGEPTIHPDFGSIIEETLKLRDKYTPSAKVSVLTNGSRIDNPEVREALLKIDNPIIKLDSAIDTTAILIDRPQFPYSINDVIGKLKPFRERYILQTMFVKGFSEGKYFDNTTSAELAKWYSFAENTMPFEIMIYSLDRETPSKELIKIEKEQLEMIAEPLREKGFTVLVAG
jgi:wyosine [tRNA(Phe)-imidazoG37] synthetase (radical SAM superfamily)